jgi:hypothetical protein
MCCAEDTTELKETSKALQESEKKFEGFVEKHRLA